jgi:hypothetical protein
MQYVQGLRSIGCDVWWLEEAHEAAGGDVDQGLIATFLGRLDRFGVRDRAILYRRHADGAIDFVYGPPDPWGTLGRADLLLNFDYRIDESLLRASQTSALVDIDPGLLQFWISVGQIMLPEHDHYLTIGETVGLPGSSIPDVGLPWKQIRPAVSLSDWPVARSSSKAPFTTVSSWWGGDGKGEWVTDGTSSLLYENNKRVSFLRFVDLPARTDHRLELALNIGTGDPSGEDDGAAVASLGSPVGITDYIDDATDLRTLRRHGWLVREAHEVAASPEAYRSYIQRSRGEFSCVKPSCIAFQNAWISDRTVCYLASGKPAIVQDTGPSSYLPRAEGLFRFSTVDEAAAALDRVQTDFARHSQAARSIAEEFFDARRIAESILNHVG